jgi:biopolymer transport protein ExbD
MSEGKKGRFHLPQADTEVDLVPLIDCVFLVLLFFMLCGRMAMDARAEQITVPPTKTSSKPVKQAGWGQFIVNVYGMPREGGMGRNSIQLGNHKFESKDDGKYEGYQRLRTMLDGIYDRAEKYQDVKNPKMRLPQVVLEIRADADTEYRVVQEIEQVASDAINPFDGMKPRTVPDEQKRSFVILNFTTRKPEDKP